MRFSLLTLILIMIWIAMAMLVWSRREPWAQEALNIEQKDVERHIGAPLVLNAEGVLSRESTDGRHVIYVSRSTICFSKADTPILTLRPSAHLAGRFIGFAGDDYLLFADNFEPGQPTSNPRYNLYYRRHPEWWWGHFYRPEVWALFVFSCVMLARFARSVLNRRRRPA
jgi:hypothetical protein